MLISQSISVSYYSDLRITTTTWFSKMLTITTLLEKESSEMMTEQLSGWCWNEIVWQRIPNVNGGSRKRSAADGR